jgi:putative superfamily III holin-X
MTGEGEGIVARLRETADGLGQLIADHVNLARVELAADVQSYVRDLTGLLVAAVIVMLGWAFAWLAAAFALSRVIGAPLAFLAVAAVHVFGGAAGIAAAIKRMRRSTPMRESASEMSRSVSALTHPRANGVALPERLP